MAAALPPIFELVGRTPLLPLRFAPEGATVHAKAEFLNPTGSTKDRLARALLGDAWMRGALTPAHTVLECSSGNTGIALAAFAAALGVRARILIAHNASAERAHLLRLLGAEVEVFDCSAGYGAGIARARELAAGEARVFYTDQFANPLNVADHEYSTGPEIVAQLAPEAPAAFVAGYGTGGTLMGVGRALRAAAPAVRLVAVRPSDSTWGCGEGAECVMVEGVARCGFRPALLDESLIDEVEPVSALEAVAMAGRLAREHGLLVGPSSGANVAAALRVAARLGPAARVVTILCDRAERYFSTRLFRGAA